MFWKPGDPLTPHEVAMFHRQADTDSGSLAIHHTLGPGPGQATAGNHSHNGVDSYKLFIPSFGEAVPLTTGSVFTSGIEEEVPRADHNHGWPSNALKQADWTDYTPVWSSGSLNNGTIQGRYVIINKMLFLRVRLTWGTLTTSTTSNWTFSFPTGTILDSTIPTPEMPIGSAVALDSSAGTRWRGIVRRSTGSETMSVLVADNTNSFVGSTSPFIWASSDVITFSIFGIEVD